MTTVCPAPRPAGPLLAGGPGRPRLALAGDPVPAGILNRVASYLSSTWLLTVAGLIILVISMALMAHAAPGPARPPSHSAQQAPGPVPGHYHGSELQPAPHISPAR